MYEKKQPYIKGLFVDAEGLKRTSRIILWGRTVRKDGTINPYMPFLDIPINWEVVFKSAIPIDAYIAFEDD